VEKKNIGVLRYFVKVGHGALHFVESVWLGFKLVFGYRRFIWLFPGYALALYLHRYLENGLAPPFAKRVLNVSAWSQIIVGGSNFGELLGALSVFVLSDHITTPLPWLRLDALMLNLVWVFPVYSRLATRDVKWAWYLALTDIPISFGWAAGDVSLAAYIQSSLSDKDFGHKGVSALGAVMAFLYSSYIILYAILGPLLGKVVDKDFERNGNIYKALVRIAGIQFSVGSAIILLSTFIPKGAFALNPKVLGTPLEGETDTSSTAGSDETEEKKHIDDDLPIVGV
jgi:hypothetical protein